MLEWPIKARRFFCQIQMKHEYILNELEDVRIYGQWVPEEITVCIICYDIKPIERWRNEFNPYCKSCYATVNSEHCC